MIKLGDIRIYPIIELECGQLLQSLIIGADKDYVKSIKWLRPHFSDVDGSLKGVVQAFLITTPTKNILIDTCNGNGKTRTGILEWNNLSTKFLSQLEDVGVNPDEIHYVINTHLHCDHVGWNTSFKNGVWEPTFKNAKYLVVENAYNYWESKPKNEFIDDLCSFEDSVLPIREAGLLQLVDMDYRLDENIKLIEIPGHTPFHVGITIEDQNEKAIICGDLFFSPLQIANPSLTTDGEFDSELIVRSRLGLLNKIADKGILLLSPHFPKEVYIKKEGNDFTCF